MRGQVTTTEERQGTRMVRSTRAGLSLALLCILLAALMAANLGMGSQPIPIHQLIAILMGADANSTAAQVLLSIRLPRLLVATLLGGALALSGLLLQTFFNNPIAGPYVLGISHGAKLAVAIVMVVVVGSHGVMSSWMSVAAACVGSLAVMALVLLASRHIGSPGMLVVAGVMIGYLCNAATDFVVTFASDTSIVNLRNWSMGSFSGMDWGDVSVITIVVLMASACVFLLSKPLGAYQLGERYAQSAGVNVGAFRAALILLSSVLAACVAAFAGPVSFVGVAVPHIARRLTGTNRPLVVVPASFLGGAAFCLLSDLIARTAFAPTEMSVSTVTALLGAPVVIAVILKSKRRSGEEVQETAAPSNSFENAPQAYERTGTSLLQTRELCVGYGSKQVLGNVSIEAGAGHIVTLVGPNGAGKSTLLRTIAGQLEALSGAVYLEGRDVGQLSERELALERAVLLTERLRTELLTCQDVVETGRYPHTGRMGLLHDTDRVAIREAMELVGVWDLRSRDFARISDGQRQRVLLARAICQDARVLVLDEPSSYLDLHYQIELLEILRRLAHDRGVAIVMSMHDLSLARQASDWLVCVRNGVVLTQGTPDQVCCASTIDKLYDLKPGTFDPLSGTIALNPQSEDRAQEDVHA